MTADGRGVFDTSPLALAERFGRLALSRIAAGREPYWSSRLAFSYAMEVLKEDRGVIVSFARHEEQVFKTRVEQEG